MPGDETRSLPYEGAAPAGPSATVRVASAGIWGLGGRVTLLVGGLVATPFTLRLLGPAQYGLWALLQSIGLWASLADVGMAFASTKFAATCLAGHDEDGEAIVIWTATLLTAVMTSAVTAVGAVYAPFIVSRALHPSPDLLASTVFALRVFCGIFVLQALIGTMNTPQVVRLRGRATTAILTLSNLVSIIGIPIGLAALAGGLKTAALVALGAAALNLSGNAVLALRLLPPLKRPRINRAVLWQLSRYGVPLGVSGVAGVVTGTAERFFLANSHSTTQVAYYAVAATLATTLLVLPEQLVAPLMPGLATLDARGRVEEHRLLYQRSLQGLYLVLTPATIILIFVARPFLTLWAGPAYGLHSTEPFLIAVVGVWFNSLAWVPHSYLLSAGKTKVIARVPVLLVLPYLLAAWALTDRYGAVGAAIAWSAMLVVDSVTWHAVVRHTSGLPVSPLSERRARSIAAPVTLGCVVLALSLVSVSLEARAVMAVVLCPLYGVFVWRWALTARERDAVAKGGGEMMRGIGLGRCSGRRPSG